MKNWKNVQNYVKNWKIMTSADALRLWGVERIYPRDFTPRKGKHPQTWKISILGPQNAHIFFWVFYSIYKESWNMSILRPQNRNFSSLWMLCFLGVKSLGYILSIPHNLKASASVIIFQFLTYFRKFSTFSNISYLVLCYFVTKFVTR